MSNRRPNYPHWGDSDQIQEISVAPNLRTRRNNFVNFTTGLHFRTGFMFLFSAVSTLYPVQLFPYKWQVLPHITITTLPAPVVHSWFPHLSPATLVALCFFVNRSSSLRWRQQLPPQRRYTSTKLRDVTSQRTVRLIALWRHVGMMRERSLLRAVSRGGRGGSVGTVSGLWNGIGVRFAAGEKFFSLPKR